jgi:hypothetical protein
VTELDTCVLLVIGAFLIPERPTDLFEYLRLAGSGVVGAESEEHVVNGGGGNGGGRCRFAFFE